jgi:UDP-N-acetylglucosamine--N-acetylmuramyl-(pentapeptide) pyrophosphoryl-undecaprenol N-acetylglucosamine transferase
MANRLVGKRVRAAAVNFPPAARWFRNVQVTGIPVRPEFFQVSPRPIDAPQHLLIFGGSQGARILNTVLPPLVPALLGAVPGLTLLHQAGARHVESTRAAYAASGADPSRWRVEAFLDNMAQSFAAASLVMARSGASTVAELAAAGKPALLIPFAAAADDHQRSNAEVMVQAAAAEMLEEHQLAVPAILLKTLIGLLTHPVRLQSMGEHARTLARPAAAQTIAAMLHALASRNTKKSAS